MNTSQKQSRPLFWFYVLVTYVFIQFAWWSFLMVELNNEIAALKTEINLLKGVSLNEVVEKGNELNVKLHHRWLMISGEGIVFLTLVITGVLKIRGTFKKEKELAMQQKNFLLSVTHELKSPIASTKLQLQTLKKHELNREKQLEIISNAISDTERLDKLVENILLAAKIENKVMHIQKEKYNLSEYISEGMKQTIQSFNYKQKVELTIEPAIFMLIDRMSFPSIILNLFENAIKYSSPDSTVTIDLKRKNDLVILTVSDQGIGIDEEVRKSIFDKFYRVGNEETRKTKGTGLGLYIVNYLVEQHNGTIKVKSNSPQGTIFEIVFDTAA